MQKGEEIDPSLIILQGIQDQLASIGTTLDFGFIVTTALNAITEDCEMFVQGILGRATIPSQEEMWVDLGQEEIRQWTKEGINGKGVKFKKEEE